MPACLPVCLPACLPACLWDCLLSLCCFLVCSFDRLFVPFACLHGSLLTCVPACFVLFHSAISLLFVSLRLLVFVYRLFVMLIC